MREQQPEDSGGKREDLWAIVLAAGEGQRLAHVTQILYGRPIPKQFAALDGTRTLLQSTMDRIGDLVPPHRTVVVVAENQRGLAEEQLAEYPGVQIVNQPANLGTGPGVLLSLSVVKAQASNAMVVITPSDHHIDVPQTFIAAIRRAAAAVDQAPDTLALVGAEADRPASDLGWIVPAKTDPGADADVVAVAGFVEKPAVARAECLLQDGALWNTMIVVGLVTTFWHQTKRHLPRQTILFDRYVGALVSAADGPSNKQAANLLARLYRVMPPADFSRTVLENGKDLSVVRLKGAGWSDCGTPERLLDCLGSPSAPEHVLKAVLLATQELPNAV